MSALREALEGLPDPVYADVLESDDGYLLVVDLPGTTEETVDVHVDGRTLHVEARREKSVPEAFRYVSEDRSLFLDATLPLPPDVAGAVTDVTVDRGVLEVRLPKGEPESGLSIPVEDKEE
jgi:HSP20 family protein